MSQKLDKTATQILKTIRKANSPVSRSVLKEHFREKNINGTIQYLLENKYIEETEYANGCDIKGNPYSLGCGKYILGIKGKIYFETHIKESFLCYYPHIISTLALIASIIALIKQ